MDVAGAPRAGLLGLRLSGIDYGAPDRRGGHLVPPVRGRGRALRGRKPALTLGVFPSGAHTLSYLFMNFSTSLSHLRYTLGALGERLGGSGVLPLELVEPVRPSMIVPVHD